ncbi:Protein of unknown function [Gryllus bimaculatus]|nr:Protein of unknown function [Gryllus bimaculatus]
MSALLCSCHGYLCLFRLIHRTIRNCRNTVIISFSKESLRRAQREAALAARVGPRRCR